MAQKSRTGDQSSLSVTVREMELHDLAAVFDLGERLFTAETVPNLYRTWDEYELVDSFSADGEFCLVAEHDERVVGFVIGTIIEKRKSAWTYGYLVWLGVEPELIGRGVARRLVARLTDLFIEDGARMMMVDTDAENENAIAFFQREGFGNPVEHVYMSKNLTQTEAYRRRREAKRSGRKHRRVQAGSAMDMPHRPGKGGDGPAD